MLILLQSRFGNLTSIKDKVHFGQTPLFTSKLCDDLIFYVHMLFSGQQINDIN